MNRGGSDPLSQGSLLGLYDPDRSQQVLCTGAKSQFADFPAALPRDLADKKARRHRAVHPERHRDLADPGRAMEGGADSAIPRRSDSVRPGQSRLGLRASKAAFGDYYDAQYRLENADVIVSLDADFLSGITHPGFLRWRAITQSAAS